MISFTFYILLLTNYYAESISFIKILQIGNLNTYLCDESTSKICQNSKKALNKIISQTNPEIVIYTSQDLDKIDDALISSQFKINSFYGVSESSCSYKYNITRCNYSIHMKDSSITFLFLDTLLSLISNKNDQVISFLHQEMKIIKKKKRKVVIVGFKSPGNEEFKDKLYDKKLYDVFMDNSKYIKGFLFYGKKLDTIRIFYNKNTLQKSSFVFAPNFESSISSTAIVRLYNFDLNKEIFDHFVDYQININNLDWEIKSPMISIMNINKLYSLSDSIIYNYSKVVEHNKSFFINTYCQFNFGMKKMWKLINCSNCNYNNNCTTLFHSNNEFQICINNCQSSYLSSLNIFNDNNDLLNNNNDSKTQGNKGLVFVLVVIVGFVMVLVGIVLAVNKVYCVHRNRQRSVFLAPLTLEVQPEPANNNNNNHQSLDSINGKLKNIVIDNNISNEKDDKYVNEKKCIEIENEKSYDYMRM